MSDLKNIFIGDKVVQQAYLNDSLFYQADTWTNTPSTYQNIYKRTPISSDGGGTTMKINSRGEIYVADYVPSSSAGYVDLRLIKLSADGVSLDSQIIDKRVGALTVLGSLTNETYNRVILWITPDDIVHIFYGKSVGTNSYSDEYLVNITDSLGSKFKFTTIHLSNTVWGDIYSVAYKKDRFYVPAKSNAANTPTSFVCFDYKGNILSTSDPVCYNSQITTCVTTDTSNCIYYGGSGIIPVELNLDTLERTNFSSPVDNRGKLKMDSMDNVYGFKWNGYSQYNGYYVEKYSPVSKKSIRYELPNYGSDRYGNEIYDIDFDSMYNIYVIGRSYNTSGTIDIMLYKYNISGTIDWKKRLNNLDSNYPFFSVGVDSLDNIYVLGSNGTLEFEKNINLQQTS